MFVNCQRCGKKFRKDGPFVTGPCCRRPDLVPRTGCRRFFQDERPLFGRPPGDSKVYRRAREED